MNCSCQAEGCSSRAPPFNRSLGSGGPVHPPCPLGGCTRSSGARLSGCRPSLAGRATPCPEGLAVVSSRSWLGAAPPHRWLHFRCRSVDSSASGLPATTPRPRALQVPRAGLGTGWGSGGCGLRLPPGGVRQAHTTAQKGSGWTPTRTQQSRSVGEADAGRCLAPAGLSHRVLLGGCSCTGTSFGRAHCTRVWTPPPTSPGLRSGAQGSRDGRLDPQTDPRILPNNRTDGARGLAHLQQGPEQGHSRWPGGWHTRHPLPVMTIVQQSLYINSLFTLNSNTDKRHINTRKRCGGDAADFGSEAHEQQPGSERRVWEGGTGTSTQPAGGRDSSER